MVLLPRLREDYQVVVEQLLTALKRLGTIKPGTQIGMWALPVGWCFRLCKEAVAMESSCPLRKLSSFGYLHFNALLTLLTFAFVLAPSQVFASRGYNGIAPPVYVEYLSIPQGGTVTFQTTNLSSGADPVMHLLRAAPGGSYFQVDYSDNYSGLNARISHTNQTSVTSFVLVLRSKSWDHRGTCDLLKNGAIHQVGAPVSGWFEPSNIFTFASGDKVRTVLKPGGSVAPFVAKFTGQYNMTGLALNNAVAKASELSVSGNETHFLVGTPYVRKGSSYTTFRSGYVVLIFNDFYNDSDGDGLGDLLEADIGTCPTVSGCPRTPHGRDTDRDGLLDGEEVLGVRGKLSNRADDLAFSRYGANPRKKDIFIEVDYLTSFEWPVGQLLGQNPFQWIRDNPTSQIGGWTGTLEAWVDKARAPFNVAPADHVRNPNGQDGVELHLDLGVDPHPYYEGKFGNWSTGSARGLVPDFIFECTGPIDGYVSVEINGATRSFDARQRTPTEICSLIVDAAKSAYPPLTVLDFDPRPDGTTKVVIEATNPGVHFTRSISVPSLYHNSIKILAEGNGSLRNHYETDPRQVDAVRRGLFRYAIITDTGGAGQSDGPKFLTGLAHSAFIHELGHTLGLQHHGHDAWGNTPTNCIPHYDSLMRYGSPPYKFSELGVRYYFHAASTAETNSFWPDLDQSRFASAPWYYEGSTATTTDWNRDGVISGSSTRYRTMGLSAYQAGCGAFSQGKQKIESGTAFVGPVDLVRFDNRLYAFWSTGTTLRYRFAELDRTKDKSCTGSPNPRNGDCLTWSAPQDLHTNDEYLGVTAYSFDNWMFVAFNQPNGVMRVRQYSVGSNGTLTYQSGTASGTSNIEYMSDYTPELVELHQGVNSRTLGLLYYARDGKFRSWGWSGSSWVHEGALQDTSGDHIAAGESPVAKAWPDSALQGWSANEKRTLAILPSAGEKKALVYILDYATNRWRQLTRIDLYSPTNGKPFLEYRTIRDTSKLPLSDFRGHFMIGRMVSSDPGNPAYVLLSSLVKRTAPPSVSSLKLVKAGGYLQNRWAKTIAGSSLSLYSDSTIDNVFGLVPLDLGSDSGLYFYPHADGSPYAVYSVYSDFKVMEDYICDKIRPFRKPNPLSCGVINVLD